MAEDVLTEARLGNCVENTRLTLKVRAEAPLLSTVTLGPGLGGDVLSEEVVLVIVDVVEVGNDFDFDGSLLNVAGVL